MDIAWEQVLFGSLFFLIFVGVLYSTWRSMQIRDRRTRRRRVAEGFAVSARKPVRREERRFRNQFPELQPFFHPEKAILFVREHRRFKPKNEAVARKRWMPAGFNSWWLVTENPAEKLQRLQLRSWRNKLRASFTYKATGEGAILGLGEGEMIVVDSKDNPHVHYRHPQRQFRWTAKKGWSVGARARQIDREPGRVDHGYVDDSPSGAGRATAGAAAAGAAVFAGQGGAFDGGGASESWEGSDASDSWEGSDASDSWESDGDGGDGGDSDDGSTD